MKKIFYNKLIRDKIPENIEKARATGSYRILNKKEFIKALIQKVEEEASGMQKARNKQELIKEIADVVDVIEEVKKTKKITNQQILRARKKNMLKKGGFNKKIFLNWSSDNGYKTNEKRYDKQSISR